MFLPFKKQWGWILWLKFSSFPLFFLLTTVHVTKGTFHNNVPLISNHTSIIHLLDVLCYLIQRVWQWCIFHITEIKNNKSKLWKHFDLLSLIIGRNIPWTSFLRNSRLLNYWITISWDPVVRVLHLPLDDQRSHPALCTI